ncbi:hypothetical protein BJ742DRAFT_814143 [Cladochytrium replicatum]|nr:hypothetical protein BJ742DRAFT_814143 [Cladochytrium replicatum]
MSLLVTLKKWNASVAAWSVRFAVRGPHFECALFHQSSTLTCPLALSFAALLHRIGNPDNMHQSRLLTVHSDLSNPPHVSSNFHPKCNDGKVYVCACPI